MLTILYHILVPTEAPEHLRNTSIDDRMIVVQWEPVKCSHRNGETTGYSVTYYPAGQMLKSTMRNVSHYNFTARGLVFNTRYVFEVQAINNYGFGLPANKILRTSIVQGKLIHFSS